MNGITQGRPTFCSVVKQDEINPAMATAPNVPQYPLLILRLFSTSAPVTVNILYEN